MAREHPGYEYKTVRQKSTHRATQMTVMLPIEEIANLWEEQGWEVVSVYPRVGSAQFEAELELLIKREKKNSNNELGTPTDVICVECANGTIPIRRKLEKKLGAWWCPIHHDKGHVSFEPHE